MTPTDAQIQQMYQDDQYRAQQYQQILQQQADRDRQLAGMKAQIPSLPLGKTLGKFGGNSPRRRSQPAQQQMTPEILHAILQAQQAEQQGMQMQEQAPEPRFTSSTLQMPSYFLREEMSRIRNKALGVGNTGGSGHNIYSAATELFGTGTTATGERKRSAVEELFGDRWGGIR